MPNSNSEFNQIKRDLVEQIQSGNAKIDKIDRFISGDPTANPPIEGIDERVKRLEAVEKDRVKNKDSLIQTAVGSITIAIGAAVIWVFIAIKEAFIKH